MEYLQQPTTKELSEVAPAPGRGDAGAHLCGAPGRRQLDGQPRRTSHEGNHDKFEPTVSRPEWLMRELAHIDARGVHQVGVRIVEGAPGCPSSDGTRPHRPRQLAFD